MLVTITKPNVYSPYGILLPVGSTQTVDTNFGTSLVQAQLALDTNNVLAAAPNAPFSAAPAILIPSSARRPLSVSAIGDSLTGHCGGNGTSVDLSSVTVAASYAAQVKTWGARSWLTHGGLRSAYSWFPFEYFIGFSGATSASVLANCLPALLGNPFGLPDACVVLAGTNDVGGSVAQAITLANLKAIYQGLINAGIVPIAATIPPTSANAALCQQLNLGIVRLAKGMKIPLADFYSILVNPANGAWLNANDTDDNIHPTPLGAAKMGYVLNLALQPWISPQNKLLTSVIDLGAGVTSQQRDPNLLTITGTINTGSSYPSNASWGAPGTIAMSTMNSGAGAEPGTGFTMWSQVPAILGGAAAFQGNSWTLAGNGANGFSVNSVTPVAANAGDKIAISARIKWIPSAAATAGGFRLVLLNGGVLLAGLAFQIQGPTFTGVVQAPIGSEAAFPAGDFYQEFTVQPANVGNLTPNYGLGLVTGFTSSNVGDSVTIANVRVVNLTTQGIVAP